MQDTKTATATFFFFLMTSCILHINHHSTLSPTSVISSAILSQEAHVCFFKWQKKIRNRFQPDVLSLSGTQTHITSSKCDLFGGWLLEGSVDDWCKSSGSWLFNGSLWYTGGSGAKKCRDRWDLRAELRNKSGMENTAHLDHWKFARIRTKCSLCCQSAIILSLSHLFSLPLLVRCHI